MESDSLTRHVWDALLLLLTSTLGTDRLFFYGKPDWHISPCRSNYHRDLSKLNVCPGRNVFGIFAEQRLPFNPAPFNTWSSTLPSPDLSSAYLNNAGIHQRLKFDQVLPPFLEPFVNFARHPSPYAPVPIMIWQGNHAPSGPGSGKYYSAEAAWEIVNYNAKVEKYIREQDADVLEGGFNFTPWLKLDPLMVNYQVNMQKEQLLLHVLDLTLRGATWRGGLHNQGDANDAEIDEET
ncbi:BQ2448_259 [Microbotryum intermedium]|uniref:BQ2448_259 protein n=1 Tax=Microbotryum intermedium TaxID=269621 RepID=A0A238FAI4_9BASI|nr:BQ2448_259 [Microbotryum intermedium]